MSKKHLTFHSVSQFGSLLAVVWLQKVETSKNVQEPIMSLFCCKVE